MSPTADPFVRRLLWTTAAILALLAGSTLLSWLEHGGPQGALAAARPVEPRAELPADEQSTIELFERARSAVVFITTSAQLVNPWTRDVRSIPRGTGSGFFWDEAGHVVTNYHVIAGGSSARVRLNDGSDYPARLVGASQAHDLAVLRIELENQSPVPLPLGSSADLRVGQRVYAIGNPFGLDWTLTTGIVSALDRSLPAEDGRTVIQHLVQTDAAINPGNSGGPLLDSAGRLIGINTAIFSPSGASAGVGFAVPVDTVNRVVPQLIETGTYVRPALGVETDEAANAMLTRRLGVRGVLVLRVLPGSPAEAAGLRGSQFGSDGRFRPGDIITALGGQDVESVALLLARLDDYSVGDRVQLRVRRGDEDVELEVELAAGS
jgi:S1-C subfamily serine protease